MSYVLQIAAWFAEVLERIEKIIRGMPEALILREKDLTEDEYEELAVPVLNLCRKAGVTCIFNGQPDLVKKLSADGLHLSLSASKSMTPEDLAEFPLLGISVHSLEEAKEAELIGASYLVFGHIFETDCKKGLQGRGLDALAEICREVSLPVYAIGGINDVNLQDCIDVGAAGGCMMSALMRPGERR